MYDEVIMSTTPTKQNKNNIQMRYIYAALHQTKSWTTDGEAYPFHIRCNVGWGGPITKKKEEVYPYLVDEAKNGDVLFFGGQELAGYPVSLVDAHGRGGRQLGRDR
jgi:hypothetical protein